MRPIPELAAPNLLAASPVILALTHDGDDVEPGNFVGTHFNMTTLDDPRASLTFNSTASGRKLAGIICKMAGPSVHAFAREGRERGSFTFPLSPPFLAEMKLAGLCRLKA